MAGKTIKEGREHVTHGRGQSAELVQSFNGSNIIFRIDALFIWSRLYKNIVIHAYLFCSKQANGNQMHATKCRSVSMDTKSFIALVLPMGMLTSFSI